jgi:hypothetical protein
MSRAFAIPTILMVALAASASHAAPVRDVLKIAKGCYPVTYDAAKDQIGVVCRGQQNWVPDGVLVFNSFDSNHGYFNQVAKVNSNLDNDLANEMGAGPWFRYYLSVLDERGIPHPK